MTDFRDALQRGMGAYHSLTQARHELRKLLSAVTENAREVLNLEGFEVVYTSSPRLRDRAEAVVSAWASLITKPPEIREVIALSQGGDVRYVIAEVEFSDTGYPITLRRDRKVFRAMTPEDLEQALSELLSTPSVGALFTGYANERRNQEQHALPPDPEHPAKTNLNAPSKGDE